MIRQTTKNSLTTTIKKMRYDGYSLFIMAFKQNPSQDEERVEVICPDLDDRQMIQHLANEALQLAATPPAIQIVN